MLRSWISCFNFTRTLCARLIRHATDLSIFIMLFFIAIVILPFFMVGAFIQTALNLVYRYPASCCCATLFWLRALTATLMRARSRCFAPNFLDQASFSIAHSSVWSTAFWSQLRLQLLSKRLALAIEHLDYASAKRLVRLGAPLLRSPTLHGLQTLNLTPLEMATCAVAQTHFTRRARIILVKTLLRAGARPALDYSLHRALFQDDQRLALTLLAAGADANALDASGLSALFTSALYCTSAISPLLAAGAHPHAHFSQTSDSMPLNVGDTVLHALARNQIWALDSYHGPALPRSQTLSDVVQTGLDATTSLIFAGSHQLLLSRTNIQGFTAFNVACSLEAVTFAHALLDAGADPRTPDDSGRTPYLNLMTSIQRIQQVTPAGYPPSPRECVLLALAQRLLIEAERLSLAEICHAPRSGTTLYRSAVRI